MPKAVDLTNQKFGLLTALYRVPSKNHHTYWMCKCECGNQKEIQTSHLTCGLSKSCGCQPSIPDNTESIEQRCPICQQIFTNRQKNRHYCYNCIPEGLSSDKRQLFKARAFKHYLVGYKGGKCEICGYNKCEGALEFHHKNPQEKDIEISKWDFNYNQDIQIYLNEVDKCMLLCANCHREQHWLNV